MNRRLVLATRPSEVPEPGPGEGLDWRSERYRAGGGSTGKVILRV